MTGPLTPDALYESAQWFAHTALQDHHEQKFQRKLSFPAGIFKIESSCAVCYG